MIIPDKIKRGPLGARLNLPCCPGHEAAGAKRLCAPRDEWCGARSAEHGNYCCSMKRGHPGNMHVACNDTTHSLAVWFDDAERPGPGPGTWTTVPDAGVDLGRLPEPTPPIVRIQDEIIVDEAAIAAAPDPRNIRDQFEAWMALAGRFAAAEATPIYQDLHHP